MASWPEQPRLIGKEIPRLDGLAKASGRAKYPSDENPEGLLHAVMLYSPYAHARITKLDTSEAEGMPGVKGIHKMVEEGATLRYHGDDILAVAAETEEQARDAAGAVQIEFEILPHVVDEERAMAPGAPQVTRGGNVRRGRADTRGNPEEALAQAAASIEARYAVPVITHVCLEPHGLTARWDGDDKLFVWSSTQAVQAVAGALAEHFEIPVSNVHVSTEVMGGGFGAKFSPDSWGIAAAELARSTGRPVKLFLDRVQEHLAAGNRPSAIATIQLGADRDGKITAMIAETHGSGGVRGGSNFPLPYVYEIPNTSRVHSEVTLNAGGARAMRAPGHPQGCIIMESAIDDLADAMGIDPLEMRLKSLAASEPVAGGVDRSQIYRDEIEMGAELIGWKQNWKPRGQNAAGPIKRGLGMGLHQWGGGAAPDKQVTCVINPDGSVELKTATQDLGTGTRTILAIIAAEILGLEPTDINSNIGDSIHPPGQASGGSTTAPSMSPPTYNAVTQARDELFQKIAPRIDARPEQLSLADGKLLVDGQERLTWHEACRRLGMMPVSVTAGFLEGMTANGVGGCQFVDLSVDIETGVVTLHKIVAIQDSGLILDRLTWDSQVYGGVIGGLNYGLFEERIMDPTTGIMLNPDMELYKLAGPGDMPEIIIRAYETPEQKARGVVGVGEPPTIATAAAIGNAVSNAIGVRVTRWPMSPMNILNALAQA